MSQPSVIAKVKEYTDKKHVALFSRCNTAIQASLHVAKSKGFEHIYIPDVAGWLTYAPYAKKAKLTSIKLATNHGIIEPKTLQLEPKSVVIFHALAGYHTLQDSKKIVEKVHEQNGFVIEDVCGSFGTPSHGDIVVGSFGKGKPVNFGVGGFAATNDEKLYTELQKHQEPVDFDMNELLKKLNEVPNRLKYLKSIVQSTVADLKILGFKPIADNHALVVIVPYISNEEKERIESYCKEKEFEIEHCPRYIRSDKTAISIEIKRK